MFSFLLGFDIALNHAWYLLLLLLIPLLWIYSFRSLSGLGNVRRWLAIALRTLVLVLLVLALAELQHLRTSEKLTVFYLLDQSASIPVEQRQAMVEYVVDEVAQHRDDARRDRAAVIVFGREANIEVPPLDDDVPIVGRLEGMLDLRTDATNLAAAMKLAQATFPEDSARRIVIVTDGNENLGDARAMARLLAEDGVGLDVVPVELSARSEVAVEKIVLPPDVRRGNPFEARVVLSNITQPTTEDAGVVRGTVKLTRRMGQDVQTLDEQEVDLAPGKTVFRFAEEIDRPDFYEYEASFVAHDPQADGMAQNNRATAFTHVLGQGHVLLIEDWENKGEFNYLVDRLIAMNLQVTVQGSDQLFSSLAELQRYDTVVLANVPRSSGGDADTLTNFSDEQIQMLVRNTQQMGSGLVMLGGRNSFGAGGWSNTELEKAMPVDFQINNAKVVPVGALVMVMHASEMAQGNHWQKVIAREALKALGSLDYCGIVHWADGVWKEDWLWGGNQGLLRVGPNRTKMLAALGKMSPGDMPDFDPSLKLAAAGFANVTDAAVKHMIIISDGDPSPPSGGALRALRNQGVKISTVAVGTHGPPGSTPLQRISNYTGGKYYVVKNPQALPRIYQREARRIARPLVQEKTVQPRIKYPHEILQGIDDAPPPITGFVLTRVKENPLVEVSLVSPQPPSEQNATILASWTYGLGRSVACTTDAGKRWATAWTGWDKYDKLFSQMVRWSMRPTGDEGKFTVATQSTEGKVRVVVTALDKDDELLNFLNMSASVVGPDMQSQAVPVRQVAPGRYVGEFDSGQAGSYFLSVTPGGGRAPIRTGVNVPYSAEFRDRESNEALLKTLAGLPPKGGRPGRLIAGPLAANSENTDSLHAVDTFRHDLAKAVSSTDVWPLLVLLAACVFLSDVFVRRVMVNLYWVVPAMAWARDRVLGRQRQPVVDERMERLRSRKAEVTGRMEERRAAARFEPSPEDEVSTEALEAQPQVSDRPAAKTTRDETELAPQDTEEDSYTARLLKAKQKAWKDKGNPS